jgi:Zn-dependent M28 family amino/carboxypeptidase
MRTAALALGCSLAALLAACSVDSATTAAPQRAATGEPAPNLIDVAQLKRDTEILSSDEFEGREPGTAGEEKTIRYLADRMAKIGLKPGVNGSWFQDVPLVTITADAEEADLRVGNMVYEYGDDVVLWTKRQQPSVSLNNSDLVFVGYGINAPERNWNDYAGLDVKGKTVIILVNDPDWQNKPGEGAFGGRDMTYYGRWTYKYEEAARQGAAGAIIIHETEPAAYGWGTVTSSWTGPQIDMDRANKGMDRVAVEGWITKDAATKLFASAGQDLSKLAEAAKQPGFKAAPLKAQASASFTNEIRRYGSKNVIGLLPGTTRPNEYVLYMAHWDHLGRCPADKSGDDICNGALDNATGTAGLLALADAHVKAGAPDRSVAFLAVTAEESGLLGSEYYAQNPVFPLAQTVGGINMDGLNIIGPTNDVVVIGAGKSQLEEYLKRYAARQNRVIVPEPTPEKGFFYRSDHFSLAKQGVPMLYADSGNDVIGKGKEWGQAQADDYTANRYHLPSDEYDPNWDWGGAVQDLRLYYAIGRELADGAAWPNWYPTAEFRAARDKSRGGK